MTEACIFDLDGVIVDTAKYHFKAWQRLADLLEIPFTEEDNEKMKGISRVASLDRLIALGEKTYSNKDKEKFCLTKNVWYLEYVSDINQSEVLPGIIDFIAQLKKKSIKIALGSASKNARKILSLVELTEAFDIIVDGNDVINSKPDPEVFLKGAEALSSSPSRTIVFEDSAKGIDAAKAGGFRTVGIGQDIHLGHADIVVEDLRQMTIEDLDKQLYI